MKRIIIDRIKIRIIDVVQRAISLFGCSSRTIEYRFVFRHLPKVGSKILDVGCCDSLFALKLAKKGYKVYGLDTRRYFERHPNLDFIQSDILYAPLPDGFFDTAIAVSTIEHVGLGAYEDPIHSDADFNAVSEIFRMLKPGGSFIVTAPFAGEYRLAKWLDGAERYYDAHTIRKLFSAFHIKIQEFFVAKGRFNWVNASESEASNSDAKWHANIALLLEKPRSD